MWLYNPFFTDLLEVNKLWQRGGCYWPAVYVDVCTSGAVTGEETRDRHRPGVEQGSVFCRLIGARQLSSVPGMSCVRVSTPVWYLYV